MSRGRKLATLAVFSAGLIVIVMSCLTLDWRINIPTGPNVDQTWFAGTIFTISVTEIDIGIMCACMPPLAPLFPGLKHSLRSWMTYFRSKGTQLLRGSQKSHPTENTHILDGNSSRKGSEYHELTERPSAPQKKNRSNWFDRSTMAVSRAEGESVTDERSIV
ncbi:hypothetical protein F4818DRAFT_451173 [Hypoxylon cercidicola]|nr:hypothetical protein F4818DRAFT_451173 [Hypoxylon cercidicola]